MEKEIRLPKLGESILSATVVKWFKKEGEEVSLDEPLLEVSTDKVASEIPAPFAGILKKIIAVENEEIKVGDLLGVIETEISVEAEKRHVQAEKPVHSRKEDQDKTDFLSPAVKKIAQEHRIPLEELRKIPCSGKRVSRSDVEAYLAQKNQKKKSVKAASGLIPLTALRKKIIDNLTKASQIPTASVFIEADVTALVQFIEKEKAGFLEKEKAKLTITSFVALAIGKAAQELALLNSTLLDDQIRLNPDVNLGIAIDREQGLIVPVVKQVNQKNFTSIAKEIAILKNKALEDKLSLQDLEGGTITLTNFGMGGVLFGIPILRYPESAIVGTGAIQKKTVFVDDKPTKRFLLPLSLTFDHRHIDGMYACAFMQKMKSFLGQASW